MPTNAPARVLIPSNGNDGTNWMLASFNDSSWRAGTNGIGYSATANTPVRSQTRTDVGTTMSNINATAYIRLPFVVSDPAEIRLVTLKIRYDDGFAAFINGVPVVQANAPETLAFNSAATNTHSASTLEEYRFGSLMLQPGTNILAIQGLNLSAADIDFLVACEFILTGEPTPAPGPLYFTTPTPGAANSGGIRRLTLQRWGYNVNTKQLIPGGYMEKLFANEGVARNVAGLVNRAIAGKMSLADFQKQFRKVFIGRPGQGMLERYWKTNSFDLFQKIDRAANLVYADRLGLEYAIYSGTVMDTTRPWCENTLTRFFREMRLTLGKISRARGK